MQEVVLTWCSYIITYLYAHWKSDLNFSASHINQSREACFRLYAHHTTDHLLWDGNGFWLTYPDYPAFHRGNRIWPVRSCKDLNSLQLLIHCRNVCFPQIIPPDTFVFYNYLFTFNNIIFSSSGLTLHTDILKYKIKCTSALFPQAFEVILC